MLGDGDQIVGVILAASMGLTLGLFLPREPGIPLILMILILVGFVLVIGGAGLSALREGQFLGLLAMKDLSQFGKAIPIGYGLMAGGALAYIRQLVFSRPSSPKR